MAGNPIFDRMCLMGSRTAGTTSDENHRHFHDITTWRAGTINWRGELAFESPAPPEVPFETTASPPRRLLAQTLRVLVSRGAMGRLFWQSICHPGGNGNESYRSMTWKWTGHRRLFLLARPPTWIHYQAATPKALKVLQFA